MKKIYAFLAAALMSASLFAAPASIPTVADLAAVADLANDVVLCLYFPDDGSTCNDVVLAGTYNEWNTNPEEMTKFEKLDGFDGWFIASFTFAEGAEGKAVQLKSDGTFDWKFQTGDVDAWNKLSDGKEANIVAGFDGESNVSYSEAGAYIYEIKYWKLHNTPCVYVPKHKYTFVLKDPFCEENPEFIPQVAGDFNWDGIDMNEGTYEGDFAWILVIESEEGNAYKFKEKTLGWDNQFEYFDGSSWKKFDNRELPVATQDTTLVFDYSDTEKFRYPLCGLVSVEVEITAALPAGAPEVGVELMGSFDGGVWDGEGLLMEIDAETGEYKATIKANEAAEFKFREKGNWDNQLEQFDGAEWGVAGNFKVGEEWEDEGGKKVIILDLSDASEWRWKSPAQGIEQIKLTEDAHKVVVDGVLYIVRDNKLFNLQGAQVR